jgi:hypothetical protein
MPTTSTMNHYPQAAGVRINLPDAGDQHRPSGPAGRGRPPQAAARRAGLEFVEKLLTTNLTSTDTTERNAGYCLFAASRTARMAGRAGYCPSDLMARVTIHIGGSEPLGTAGMH